MDATTAEAWACRDGMKLGMKCGVVKLCLESDCLELVRLWQSRETQRSLIAPVLMEIARQANSMSDTAEWHFEAPSSIQSLLEADCNPVL
jgi:hypothetical protein